MPEIQYHQLADHALEDLLERIEEFLEVVDVDDSDIEFSQGVLTIRLGKLGTYVINKQTPNRQIWMSSPISGPVRYDYEKGAWVYHRDGHKMHERLENEMEQLTGVKVDLNPCTTCERLGTCVNGSDCPV
jgi:frataxin